MSVIDVFGGLSCGHMKGVASTRQGLHRLMRLNSCSADAQMYVGELEHCEHVCRLEHER